MTVVVNQLLDDQTSGSPAEDEVSDRDEGSLLDGESGASVLTFDVIRGEGSLAPVDINMAGSPKS